MSIVIEGKNGRALTLPALGRAITLVFLQTVAVLIALWYAVTGGGRRFHRLTQQNTYERDLLDAAVGVLWRKGRFANDNPFTAIRRLFHIVIAIAWHAEVRGRPDLRIDPGARDGSAAQHAAAPVPVTPDDSS